MDGIAHYLHKFVDGEVVAIAPAPVVFNFETELCVEGVVRIARKRYVVICIDTEALSKGHRRVALAFVGEVLRKFAQVTINHGIVSLTPYGRELFV